MMNDNLEISKNIGAAAYGFFKSFLQEQKTNLNKFFIKHKVGFIPAGVDYSILQKITKKTTFKQLKFLIGKHSTLPIVLTGLWINSLSEKEQINAIEEGCKSKIYKKHGNKGVNILNMAGTGFMESFIKFLSNYNLKKNPTKEELIDIYENALDDWSMKTIFVQKDSSTEFIIKKCTSKMNQDIPFFYMFASYSAIQLAEEVISVLIKNNILKESNFEVTTEKINSKGTRKVWIFEKE